MSTRMMILFGVRYRLVRLSFPTCATERHRGSVLFDSHLAVNTTGFEKTKLDSPETLSIAAMMAGESANRLTVSCMCQLPERVGSGGIGGSESRLSEGGHASGSAASLDGVGSGGQLSSALGGFESAGEDFEDNVVDRELLGTVFASVASLGGSLTAEDFELTGSNSVGPSSMMLSPSAINISNIETQMISWVASRRVRRRGHRFRAKA